MKDLVVSKVELDELWTFVQKNKYREWKRYEDDGTSIWASFASECRLVIAHAIGKQRKTKKAKVGDR